MSAHSTAGRTGEFWRMCRAWYSRRPRGVTVPAIILFVRENTLMAVPFDPPARRSREMCFRWLRVSRSPRQLISTGHGFRKRRAAVRAGGPRRGQTKLAGTIDPVNPSVRWARPAVSSAPRFPRMRSRSCSPRDERRVRSLGARSEPWNGDAVHQRCIRSNIAPFWSPKGDRIVFTSNRKGVLQSLSKGRERKRAG